MKSSGVFKFSGAGFRSFNIESTSCNSPLWVFTSFFTCSNSASCDSHSNQWQFVLHLETRILRLSHIMIARRAPKARFAALEPRKLL